MPDWSLLNVIPDAAVVVDNRGVVVFFSEAAQKIFLRTAKEVVGRPVEILIPTALHERHNQFRQNYAEKPIRRAMGSGRVLYGLRGDETTIPIEVALSTSVDESGAYTICIIREAATRLLTDATLRLQAAALGVSANAIVITTRDGIITWANPAFATLTGYSLEEVIGRKTSLLRSGVHDDTFYANIWSTVLAGDVWRGDIINRRKDGSLYVEEQTISPVPDEHGNINHFIAIKQDATEKRQNEAALRRQNEYLSALHGMTLGLLSRDRVVDRKVLEGIVDHAAQILAELPTETTLTGLLGVRNASSAPAPSPKRTPISSLMPRHQSSSPPMSTDLQEARDFQRKALPALPQLDSLTIEVIYQPLEFVGGDIYQMAEIRDGCFRVFLADATGHGVQASLTTVLVLSEYELTKDASGPAEVLHRMNQRLSVNFAHLGVRITAICLDVNVYTGELCFASAAHPVPCILRQESPTTLEICGGFIGISPDESYPETILQLEHGDAVLVYTDGITDATNATGQLFGEERLFHAALEARKKGHSIQHSVEQALTAFAGNRRGQQDDTTLIALRWFGLPRSGFGLPSIVKT